MSSVTETIEIKKADGAYLSKYAPALHRLAEQYHTRAGPKTHDADGLMAEFFTNIEKPNCLLLIVEQEEKPIGFLFGLAQERTAFLNAAYLGLKNKERTDSIKRDCLHQFDEWALSLKCEQAVFTTYRGTYAHKWAEQFGWNYQFTIYNKDLK